MRLSIFFLLLISFASNAAPSYTVLNYGTNYCQIGQRRFPLNSVSMTTNYKDTSIVEFDYASIPPSVQPSYFDIVISPAKKSIYYINGSTGDTFKNAGQISAFYSSHFVSSSGGGVSMAIGAPVRGGTNGDVLTITSGNLSQTGALKGLLVADTSFMIGDGLPGTPIAGTTTYTNVLMNGKNSKIYLNGHGRLFLGTDYTLHSGGGFNLIAPLTFQTNQEWSVYIFNP